MAKEVSEISYLKGVGPKRAEAFQKLGIERIDDLFSIYPRDYIGRCDIRSLFDKKEKYVLICGTVIEKTLPRRPNHPTRIAITDKTASISMLLWGNAIYREKQFKAGDKYLFWGKVTFNSYEQNIQFDYRDHKKYEDSDEGLLKYPFIPLYILSTELKKTWIRPLSLTKIIFTALKQYSGRINEVLSDKVRDENNLLSHKSALLRMHYPKNEEEIEQVRQTLAFEELFYLQLIMALKRKRIEGTEKGIYFDRKENLVDRLRALLQFELTNAQQRVIKELFDNMCSSKPMNRLLQGDVGSGKTIVALSAMLLAIENGYQCAFMCPTEILAEQHNKVVTGYLDALGLKTVLLVGGQKKKLRESLLYDIRSGNADVIVGTHALIQDAVEFNKLGLIVIDEQHKFGVMQRARLRQKSVEKGINPDVLVMTATPIPRTLSLTIYGDLDVSVIDELPKNRKQIKTAVRTESDRQKVYKFIRDEVKKGRQVYIVYPLINESEKLDLKAAEVNYGNLSKAIFSDLKIGMVHGRMLWYEIDETIEAFKDRKIDILVSTTVIEVGIDIPNATIMVIEEAQRFGLSQLHQLRGRVGRGGEQSYCILMTNEKLLEVSQARLDILTKATDGFIIAEKDLEIRGPGEFFGIRQSGELKFTAADLTKDKDLIEKTRSSAIKLVNDDVQLRKEENKIIREHFLTNYQDSMSLVDIA